MKKQQLLFFSIVINVLVYFLLVYLHAYTAGKTEWFFWGGDTREYLCYGESMLNGEYRCGDEFLNRMPGLPVVYAFFRLFTDQNGAMLMIVLLQVFFSGISMYYLTLIAKENMGVKLDSRWLILFFSTMFAYKVYDPIVLTESLAMSTIIIGLYFIFRKQRNLTSLIVAGICFAWCIFLRPYTILLLGLASIYCFYKIYRDNSSLIKTLLLVVILLLPFVIAEGFWVTRNFKVGGKFVPFQDNRYAGLNESSAFEESSYVKLWSWMLTMGEDAIYWNPGSMGSWIYGGDFKPDTFIYKPHMFSNSYGIKDIEQVRSLYQMQLHAATPAAGDSIERILVSKVDTMIISYKKEKFFEYHFVAPLRILKKTFIHSGSVIPVPQWPDILKNPFFLVIKVYAAVGYLVILLFGLASILIWWKKNAETTLVAVMTMSIICVLALFFRYTEFRLYIIIFPLLAAFAIKLIDYLFQIINSNRRKNIA